MRNVDKHRIYNNKMPDLPAGYERFATYNLQQAAALLGVCDKTLKKLAESGAIQRRRVGRRWILPTARCANGSTPTTERKTLDKRLISVYTGGRNLRRRNRLRRGLRYGEFAGKKTQEWEKRLYRPVYA